MKTKTQFKQPAEKVKHPASAGYDPKLSEFFSRALSGLSKRGKPKREK